MKSKTILIIILASYVNLVFGQKKEIYREDFNDNTNNWSEKNDENAEYFFRGGQYCIINKTEKKIIWHTKKVEIDTSEDFIIESSITLNWDKERGAGIIFGVDNISKNNFYIFEIICNKGNYYSAVTKKLDGEWSGGWIKELKKNKVNGFGMANKLTISKIKNEMSFFINDYKVYSKTFENFFGDGIGVYCTAQQNASFDYLIAKQDKQSTTNNIVYETKRDIKIINKTTKIKLKKLNGIYEVPVELNDVLKINFIFDSGASDVSISPDVALTLIKTGTITEDDWLPGAYYSFADGSSAKSMRFKLHSVKIGDKIAKDVVCSISNSTEAPMLLGQSVLSKFGRYTFDYKTETLEIE